MSKKQKKVVGRYTADCVETVNLTFVDTNGTVHHRGECTFSRKAGDGVVFDSMEKAVAWVNEMPACRIIETNK